nr:unnamed protein product [Callosobruchus chinensis]
MGPRENASVSTEELITEVERRPPIWNVTLIEYADKSVRKQLWNEIVKLLGPEGMRSDEKAELVSDNTSPSTTQEEDPLEDEEYRPQHKAKKKKVEVEQPVVMEMVSVMDTSSSLPHEDNESDKLFLLSLLDGFRRIPDACKTTIIKILLVARETLEEQGIRIYRKYLPATTSAAARYLSREMRENTAEYMLRKYRMEFKASVTASRSDVVVF